MKIISFLLGFFFDESLDFIKNKTKDINSEVISCLKKIHKYVIICFMLTIIGTICLCSFIVKLGMNLDAGFIYSPSLILFLVICLMCYGYLFILINNNNKDHLQDDYIENDPSLKIQQMLEEMIQQQISKPRVPKKRTTKKRN